MRSTITGSLVATVLLLSSASVAGAGGQKLSQVTRIPFSDWLAAQGGTLVAFQARTSSEPNAPLGNLGVVDYAGVRAAANALSYGFSADGTITLKQNEDGTGEVNVNVDFSNAINWANDVNGVRIFGYSPGELAASPAATPGLASGHLQAKYTVPDASHPALDLAAVTFFGAGTLVQLKFHSTGMGPLRPGFGVPDGTPGQCNEENNGLFNTSGGGATADAYPCEKVDVRATGGASAMAASGAARTATPAASAGGGVNAARPAAGSWGAIKVLYR
jgi:hypothetical protein